MRREKFSCDQLTVIVSHLTSHLSHLTVHTEIPLKIFRYINGMKTIMNTARQYVPAGLRYWSRDLGAVNRVKIQSVRAGQACVDAANTFLSSPKLTTVSEAMGTKIGTLQQDRACRASGADIYKVLFESLYNGHGVYDPAEGRFTDCNQKVCEMMRCEKKDIIGRTPLDFMPEQQPGGRSSAEIARELIEKVSAARPGESFKQYFVQRRKDGTLFDSEVLLTPFIYEGKTLIHATMHDLTEVLAAERKYANEHRLLLTLMDSTPGIRFWAKDREGRFTVVNRATRDFFGVNYQLIIGKTDRDVFDETIADSFERAERDVIENERPMLNIEEMAYDAEGIPRWCLTSKIPQKDAEGKVIGMIGMNVDITEHKLTVFELQESEDKFNKAFRSNPALMAISDPATGKILDANDSFCEVLGYVRDEVIGKSTLELGIFDAAKRDAAVKEMTEKGKLVSFEMDVKASGGKMHTGLFSGELIEIKGEKRLLTVMVDITERKKLEEQLRQAQKMENIGIVAGGVGHDLNNLLMPVLGNIEMLLQDINDTAQREMLEQAQAAALDAQSLVNRMLDFGRQRKTVKSILSLNQVVSDSLRLLKTVVPKTIDLRISNSSRPDRISSDRVQLDQILMNLVVNASHALEGRERACIDIEISDKEMVLTDKETGLGPGRYVSLTVRDNGCGIPPENMQKIFDAFFTTKDNKGTGLGLSNVAAIVKDHNGAIHLESTVEQGTAFTIYFPAVD